MNKLRFLLSTIISFLTTFIFTPKPEFELFGINWLGGIVFVVFLTLFIRDLAKNE